MDKIYEGSHGSAIKISISGVEDFTKIQNPILKVLTPLGSEEEWECSVMIIEESLVHVIPNTYTLVPGTYFIQPWFNYDSWYGPWSPVRLTVYKKYT